MDRLVSGPPASSCMPGQFLPSETEHTDRRIMECHSLMAVNQRHSDILHKDFEIKTKTEDRLSLNVLPDEVLVKILF